MGVSDRPQLGRNVIVLCWVSLLQDAASELLYPVLPLFLTGVLGAPVAVVGLIEGVAEATASVTKIGAGRLADRRDRKPLIEAGYAVSSVGKMLIAVSFVWPAVLVAKVVDRFGKGVRTGPRDAMLVAGSPPELRGRAFGLHRAADTTGAVIGPLLALVIYELANHNIRLVLVVAVVPAVFSAALTGLIREQRRPDPVAPTTVRHAPAVPLPRPFWRVVTFLVCFGLVNFPDALLILRASELGFGFVRVVLVYALYNASYAALSYPAGAISDRVPRRWVFATGLAIFSLAYTGLGLLTHQTRQWVWVLLPVYGGYTALTDGVGKAWVADLLPDAGVGTGLGLYQGLTGGAALVAGIWAGLAWGGTGRVPLLLSGLTAGVLALGLALSRGRLEGNRGRKAATRRRSRPQLPQP